MSEELDQEVGTTVEAMNETLLEIFSDILGNADSAKTLIEDMSNLTVEIDGKVTYVNLLHLCLHSLLPEEFLRNYFPVKIQFSSLIRDLKTELTISERKYRIELSKRQMNLETQEGFVFVGNKEGNTDAVAKAMTKNAMAEPKQDLKVYQLNFEAKLRLNKIIVDFLQTVSSSVDLYVSAFSGIESLLTVGETWYSKRSLIQEMIQEFYKLDKVVQEVS